MKVVVVSMVRNEADVIEAFVRHHAELADELILVDHGSVDGTGDILRELAAEGLPLSVRGEPSAVQRQNAVLTGLLREAARDGADWIVPVDADEFLLAPVGGLETALAGCSEANLAELRLYVPTAGDPADEPNVLRRIAHRRPAEAAPWMFKLVVPAAAALDERVELAQGNHAFVKPGSVEYLPAPVGPLALAHFPVRSAGQLARKVLGGWPAHLARPDATDSQAFQWKRAFDAVVAGEHLTADGLERLALDYGTQRDRDLGRPCELVLDPVAAGFELRYPPPGPPTPLAILAATAEALARELSAALA